MFAREPQIESSWLLQLRDTDDVRGWRTLMVATTCALAVVGCGRLGFGDATPGDTGADSARLPCVPTSTNDDDGDGVVDDCDVCPHVIDPTQLDGDGDGVGDACDRSPRAQRITIFDAFTGTALAARWQLFGAGSVANSRFVGAGITGSTAIGYPGTTIGTELSVRGRITGVGTGPKQLSLQYGTVSNTDDGEYCEVYGDGSLNFKITRATGATFTTLSGAPITTSALATGPFVMRFGVTASGMFCDLELGGSTLQITSPEGFAAPRAYKYLQVLKADFEIDNFVEISTLP